LSSLAGGANAFVGLLFGAKVVSRTGLSKPFTDKIKFSCLDSLKACKFFGNVLLVFISLQAKGEDIMPL